MPIISRVGRRSLKIRLVTFSIYVLLCVGGLTMVYPYAITITQSVSNKFDYERYAPIPYYLFSQEERYLKYLAERYDNQSFFSHFRTAYRAPIHWGSFRDVAFEEDAVARHFPVYGSEKTRLAQLKAVYEDYCEFLKSYDTNNTQILFSRLSEAYYQQFLLDRYGRIYLENSGKSRGDLSRKKYETAALQTMGELCGTSYTMLLSVRPDRERRAPYDLQTWFPPDDRVHHDYLDFMKSRPAVERIPITRHFIWSKYLLAKVQDLTAMDWPGGRVPYETIYHVPFDLPSDSPRELKDLKDRFLKESWPVRLVRVSTEQEPAFREFIKKRYPSLEAYNLLTERRYESWEEVPFSRTAPSGDNMAEQAQWRDFVLSLSRDRWEILCPETAYQEFLTAKHGSLDRINELYGWNVSGISRIELPIAETDYYYYVTNKGAFYRGYLTNNFRRVLDFMMLRGRAFWNTFILVFFSIFAALTVNPLAAYALSRFRPRQTYQILIFFLATMAFPPMVAAIPSFLLLRDLHLLNTFPALILPAVVNGYAIFLLKGFFDSLPQELYEAATIDGATEAQIFVRISIPLVKPILAVIALQSFIMSYGGFMWALIVCQKEEMWTLTVWMFQFYSQYAREMPFMATAGLVLTSIPTLLVFLFCQKIILRGIIIPTMK